MIKNNKKAQKNNILSLENVSISYGKNEAVKNVFCNFKKGDITSLSCIEKSKSTSAELISKDEGIIAGIELAKQIFEFNSTNLLFTRFVSDGEKIKNGQKLLSVSGNAREILAKE